MYTTITGGVVIMAGAVTTVAGVAIMAGAVIITHTGDHPIMVGDGTALTGVMDTTAACTAHIMDTALITEIVTTHTTDLIIREVMRIPIPEEDITEGQQLLLINMQGLLPVLQMDPTEHPEAIPERQIAMVITKTEPQPEELTDTQILLVLA
jgi:hypothetical protein